MFRNIRKLFKIRPKKFLGIDIGTSSLRVVELGRRGQTYRLENYGEIRTSAFKEKSFRVFQKNSLTLSNRQVSKAIRAIFKEAGIQTEEINLSIPDFCSFSTTFKLPVMGKDEVPEAVNYEVRPFIPLPLTDVTLDWFIIEGEPSRTPLKILVVAIPNDIINQYQDITQLAGLKLRILEPEVFALARASIKDEEAKEITGLIDIGARSTTCSILEKGILKSSHSFNIAGNSLVEVIAGSLNIEHDRAEELKRKYGLIPDSSSTGGSPEKIRKILIPLIDSILEEIRKVFRSFYRQEGKRIEKIVLAGGLISMPGLKEYFSAELKKKIIISDPFLHIACPSILTETLKEIGPSYAIAVGLALKGLE